MSTRRGRRMVFCGIAFERLALLVQAGTLESLDGRGPTRTVVAQHDLGEEAGEEEADYLAQSLASLDSLLAGDGPRLVLAVDAEREAVTVVEESIGHLRLTPFDWSWVTAVFVDEADSLPALAEARRAIAQDAPRVGEPGQPEAVTELLEEHPLLWFLPSELDELERLHA